MPKPIKLYLLKDNNLLALVKCEKIKSISKKKSVFGALSFKLLTVLKMLQKTNHFA